MAAGSSSSSSAVLAGSLSTLLSQRCSLAATSTVQPRRLQRTFSTSASSAAAPIQPRTLPISQARAGTKAPKDIVEQTIRYPNHPLNAFFHFMPREVPDPSAGFEADGITPKKLMTISLPMAVTENDFTHTPGRRQWAWSELRRKSSVELHQLWYVCLKERNILLTTQDELRRASLPAEQSESINRRHNAVRKTMSGIKFVLHERRRALLAAQQPNKTNSEAAVEPSTGEANGQVPETMGRMTPRRRRQLEREVRLESQLVQRAYEERQDAAFEGTRAEEVVAEEPLTAEEQQAVEREINEAVEAQQVETVEQHSGSKGRQA